MLTLLEFNLPVLAAAMLIGIATGYWIFRGRPPAKKQEDSPSP
jgi:hypothetical protein